MYFMLTHPIATLIGYSDPMHSRLSKASQVTKAQAQQGV